VTRQNAALRIALSSKIYYKIHSLASTSAGTSRSEIHELLGVKGSMALDELLNQGVLNESDGCISDPFYNLHQSNEEILRRMIEYNLDDFYPNDLHAGILNVVEGFNDEGLDKVRALVRKFNLDLQRIIKDPQFIGREKLFISAVMGKLFPNKVDSGYEPNSESVDITSQEKLSALVHDMRAPMKYVLSFLDNHASEDLSETQLNRARNAAVRVDLMIDSLKNLNGHEIASRQMDTFVLDSMLEFASTLADDYQKKFQYSGHKEFSGYMDKNKIDRLIQNLLMNAFEAADSLVEFKYHREKDSIIIMVSDDGPGVPQNYVDKIFERGFTFGKIHGTGLGLATVKAIAQGHEGEVWYEREGGKTFFKVLLRNVFTDSVFEEELDPVAESFEPTQNTDGRGKPILILKLSDGDIHTDRLSLLRKELSSYFVTDDLFLLSHARVVCTDNVELASQALEAGVRRVWTLPPSVPSHPDFVPALVRLAHNEFPEPSVQSSKEAM
jgi:signal transduction histidine kinase